MGNYIGQSYDDQTKASNTSEKITVTTQGQTLVNFITTTYQPGGKRLMVWVNGVFQSSDAYSETNSTSITFTSGLDYGDIVYVVARVIQNIEATALETGSFTPVVLGTTAAGAGTYSIQYGTYRKLDSILFFTLKVTYTGHTGTGNIRISGLPYVSKNITNYAPVVTVGADDLTFPAGSTQIYGVVNTGLSTIDLRASGTGLAGTAVAMDAAATLNVSGFYEIY